MPGYLLHQGATILCLHAGQAQPTAPNPRVKVSGQPISTQAGPYTVAGCINNISGTPVPCLSAQWITTATRLRAGGTFVLLQDSQAVCAPNGTGVNIIVTQVRVKGM
jgi:hypothetical protein